ncbi:MULTISPECIES: sensor domain-containing protein [unclassified Rhizobium]|uniref:sensor domain-containing protein n=1 Tax=unclassified Rhizobium TaxID=2613769 RepID=UPI00177B664A|nr:MULTISPECIES: EAL domain-containing protein [unclassified Rhizobium]MBD8689637.1 EAL domain-containing protein [Rhizobium sp. CFBP 13644]MBD8694244.1 EAL domain-containing protein [Rhizobium sp. CFBP 13717]
MDACLSTVASQGPGQIALGTLTDAIVKISPSGKFLAWEPVAQQNDWMSSQMLGQNFSCLFSPSSQREGVPARNLLAARRRGYSTCHLALEGSSSSARIVLVGGELEDGPLVGFFFVSHPDERFERSRYESLALDHIPSAVCVLASSGEPVFHNRQFEKLVVETDACSPPLLATSASIATDERYKPLRALLEGTGLLRLSSGRVMRSTFIDTPEGERIVTINDITEQHLNEKQYAHLANHDALTGLPNRRCFIEMLESEVFSAAKSKAGLRVAVIGIDLDRFKYINDTYGHSAGDVVLRTISDRLVSDIGANEVVARFGGDEFAAMKTYVDDMQLKEFVARIQRHITEPMLLPHGKVVTGASIGVAVYPNDAQDRESLIKNADLAMYRAKTRIGETICYFDASLDEVERMRLKLAGDIWDGVEQGQFFLNYQIQKTADTNVTSGYEALLRWRHPTMGLIAPDRFIEIAEQCGAIIPLGDWVLDKACSEAAKWSVPHRIAVNLSPLQLGDVQIVDRIREILMTSGLAPSRLELEITETALMADRTRALHILRQIKAFGVSIALDDFGTGYSSFETLRAFPFDRIKLDRSFVAGIDTTRHAKAFIRAILALGKSLKVPVLAEGVETAGQRDFLLTEGLDEFQGFLFGRPLDLESIYFGGEEQSQGATYGCVRELLG